MTLPKFNTSDIGHRIYRYACRYKKLQARVLIHRLHGPTPFDAHDLLSKWKDGYGISWSELVQAICSMLPQEVGQKLYDAKQRADIKGGYAFSGYVNHVTRGHHVFAVGMANYGFRRTFRRIIRNAAK